MIAYYYCAANKPMQILNTLHYMIKYIVGADFFNDNKVIDCIFISIIYYYTEVISKRGIEICFNLNYVHLNNYY